jgi:hypothetical protein
MTDEEIQAVNDGYARVFRVVKTVQRASTADGAAFGIGAFGFGFSLGDDFAGDPTVTAAVLTIASGLAIGCAAWSFLLTRRAEREAGIR